MSFNSWEFAWFFLAVFGMYYLPLFRKHQPLLLIVASLLFYWRGSGALAILLLASIVFNAMVSFLIGLRHSTGDANGARNLAIGGIVFNVALLGFFKYGTLVASSLRSVLPSQTALLPSAEWIPLPLGISFYCFEGISLVVDSYKKLFAKPKKLALELRDTSLFISFFPHLISGPILRAAEYMPQISGKRFADIDWYSGFRWIVLGFFLKCFVADNLAEYTVHLQYPEYAFNGTWGNIVLLYGYSIQIFSDFGGYSFIALGLAELLGYKITNNFNAPYISKSFGEFWRRWHISLSRWIRDYMFIPLGGSRGSKFQACRNVLIVMFIGGLWHGASWNYAIWGLLHGAGLILEHAFSTQGVGEKSMPEQSIGRDLRQIAVCFFFVTLIWLAFVYHDVSDMAGFVQHTLTDFSFPLPMQYLGVLLYSSPAVLLHVWHYLNERNLVKADSIFRHSLVRAASYGAMMFLSLVNAGSSHAFIYFQF